MSCDEIRFDYIAFDTWIQMPDVNGAEAKQITQALTVALNEYCTETQRKYIMHYFMEQMSQLEIAKMYGVDYTAVGRTIRRGMRKVNEAIRFSSARLLTGPQQDIRLPRCETRKKRKEMTDRFLGRETNLDTASG